MKRAVTIVVSLLFISSCKIGINESALSIQGGDVAVSEEALLKLYMVDVAKKNVLEFCTASPIDSSIAITAAHCVTKLTKKTGMFALDGKRALAVKKALYMDAYMSPSLEGYRKGSFGSSEARNDYYDVALLYFDQNTFDHWIDVASDSPLEKGSSASFYGFGKNQIVEFYLSDFPTFSRIYYHGLILWKSRNMIVSEVQKPEESEVLAGVYKLRMNSTNKTDVLSIGAPGDSGGPMMLGGKIYGIGASTYLGFDTSTVTNFTSLQYSLVKQFVANRNLTSPPAAKLIDVPLDAGSYQNEVWFQKELESMRKVVDYLVENKKEVEDIVSKIYKKWQESKAE